MPAFQVNQTPVGTVSGLRCSNAWSSRNLTPRDRVLSAKVHPPSHKLGAPPYRVHVWNAIVSGQIADQAMGNVFAELKRRHIYAGHC